jgi:hypothetical protein
MSFAVGQRVVAESESTNRQPRRGVIQEVLRGEPSPRYRIRWDDGHESIYTPADGALRAGPGRGRTKLATTGKRRSPARRKQASASSAAGRQKLTDKAEPEAEELAQYYRDEDQHIHLLE